MEPPLFGAGAGPGVGAGEGPDPGVQHPEEASHADWSDAWLQGTAHAEW